MKSLVSRSWMIGAAAGLALFTASCASQSAVDDDQVEPPAVEEQTEAQDQEPAAEDAPGAADDSAGRLEIPTEKLDGALVDSFPDDVPLYDGDIYESSSSMGEVTENPEWGVMLFTPDPIDTVDAGIRDAYSTNGWEIRSDMEFMGGYQLIAHHAGYIVSITYHDAYSEDISITYGVSAKG